MIFGQTWDNLRSTCTDVVNVVKRLDWIRNLLQAAVGAYIPQICVAGAPQCGERQPSSGVCTSWSGWSRWGGGNLNTAGRGGEQGGRGRGAWWCGWSRGGGPQCG